jgi:hypothetical protein
MKKRIARVAIVLATLVMLMGVVLAPVAAGAMVTVAQGQPVIELIDAPLGLLADPLAGGGSGA